MDICTPAYRFVSQINVEVPLFLYMVASFMHYPVFQSLVYVKCCVSTFGDDASTYCTNSTLVHADTDVQTCASHFLLYSNLLQTFTAVPTTILLGTFGDRKSRKLSMLVPFVGVILADVNYIAQSYASNRNVYLLLISDAVFGICGGYSAIIGSMFSYGAAFTSKEGRSYRMALLEGTIGLGGTVGYILSGFVLSTVGFGSVFLTELALHSVAFFFIVAVIRDIESDDDKAATTVSYVAWIWIYVRDACLTAFKKRDGSSRQIILTIFVSFLFSYLVFSGSQDILFYYLKLELNWTSTTYGYLQGITYGLSTITILVLYPLLKKFAKFADTTLSGIGVLSRLVGSLLMVFIFSNWFVFTVSLFYMFNRFASAGMRSLASKEVDKDEQGKLFAAIALLEALCGLVASAIFNYFVYPASLSWFPGFSYALMAAFMLVPLFGLISVHLILKKKTAVSTEEELLESSDSAGSADDPVHF